MFLWKHVYDSYQGRTQGGGARAPHPLGPENSYIFRVSSVKLRDLHLWSLFFWRFLLCGRIKEACSMVNSLRKVDFSRPTGHYKWKKFGPLEKILGAPPIAIVIQKLFRKMRGQFPALEGPL